MSEQEIHGHRIELHDGTVIVASSEAEARTLHKDITPSTLLAPGELSRAEKAVLERLHKRILTAQAKAESKVREGDERTARHSWIADGLSQAAEMISPMLRRDYEAR